jgi:ACS family D-galactonate transporter-like MFS transporter
MQNAVDFFTMHGISERTNLLSPFGPALALLSISILINYVDRGNLSLAAPLLKSELHLSTSQLGILLSAFFWAYTAFIFVSGYLVDRFNVNLVIAVGYTIWSLATAATGLAHAFVTLFVMRLLLGVGESVAFPACSKILACNLPEHHRGFANGLIICSLKFGPAVGTFGAGLLMTRYGWRPVFVVVGLVALIWIPAWMKWMPQGPTVNAGTIGRAPHSADILLVRSFWGATLGHFCVNYVLYFTLTWLPFYLVHDRQLSMQSMVHIASVYYVVDALSALITGSVTDAYIRGGRSVSLVRKSAMGAGNILAAIGLAACAFAGQQTYLTWLLVAALGSGMSGTGVYAFSQTLAGPQATGRWTGLQNGLANLAGIISPALTGFLVDHTGRFTVPLLITALTSIIGAIGWTLVVRHVQQVTWPQQLRHEPLSAQSM